MDYLVGFIFGYFIKNFYLWLDKIAEPKIPKHYKEDDWDWIT